MDLKERKKKPKRLKENKCPDELWRSCLTRMKSRKGSDLVLLHFLLAVRRTRPPPPPSPSLLPVCVTLPVPVFFFSSSPVNTCGCHLVSSPPPPLNCLFIPLPRPPPAPPPPPPPPWRGAVVLPPYQLPTEVSLPDPLRLSANADSNRLICQ